MEETLNGLIFQRFKNLEFRKSPELDFMRETQLRQIQHLFRHTKIFGVQEQTDKMN